MKKILTGLLVLVASLLLIYKFDTQAESLPTNLTVGNSPPSFTAVPAENPAGGVINEGSDISFEATANEPNGENYYLAVCKINSITPGSSGAAPTCGGGAYCVSNSTTSDSQASCTHSVSGGADPTSNWYAFVCDDNTTSSECSSSSQGTGTSGSPFYTNLYPEFTTVFATSSADPGGTISFTTSLTFDTEDDVKLVVCGDTSGATGAGCSGTELCVSGNVEINPSCQYNIPSVAENGTYNYYAYVFDSQGLGASENYRSGTYSINNVAPVVSSVTINGGSDITLTAGTTTDVIVTGTVTDNNSCQDLVTVEASVYRSGIGYSSCDTDAEDEEDVCYAQVSCTVSGGSCAGATDASANYTCTVPVQYLADPTVAVSEYPSENWLSTMNAIDSALSDNAEVASGVEMNTLNAIEITHMPGDTPSGTIDYGNLDVGQRNSTLSDSIRVYARGNTGYDIELSGANLTDGGSGVINVNKERYEFCSNKSYIGDGITLTSSPIENELDIAKPYATTQIYETYRGVWWGIEIPTNIPPGAYTGTVTVTSVIDEVATWGYEMFCLPE